MKKGARVRQRQLNIRLPLASDVVSLYESISSFRVILIGGKDTIWFQGTYSVLVWGLNGLRWNWRVTASPPLTITSNLFKRRAPRTDKRVLFSGRFRRRRRHPIERSEERFDPDFFDNPIEPAGIPWKTSGAFEFKFRLFKISNRICSRWFVFSRVVKKAKLDEL